MQNPSSTSNKPSESHMAMCWLWLTMEPNARLIVCNFAFHEYPDGFDPKEESQKYWEDIIPSIQEAFKKTMKSMAKESYEIRHEGSGKVAAL